MYEQFLFISSSLIICKKNITIQYKNYSFNYFLRFLIIIIFLVSNSNFTKEKKT